MRERWKQVRILSVGERPAARQRKLEYRSIPGGMLVQDRDGVTPEPAGWEHRAGPEPSDEQIEAARVLVVAVSALSSNAIAIGGIDSSSEQAGAPALFGAGAGQMDRVAASKLAIEKAGERCVGAVAVSDAFFPFPDGPELLINAGVRCIVHPGGSRRDEETFRLCDERGVTCLVTGVRRFRH